MQQPGALPFLDDRPSFGHLAMGAGARFLSPPAAAAVALFYLLYQAGEPEPLPKQDRRPGRVRRRLPWRGQPAAPPTNNQPFPGRAIATPLHAAGAAGVTTISHQVATGAETGQTLARA
ncbi:MAG: hypothetical protein IPK75_20475 [Acidobacteria bacterium]|nr:hypothetical protein [Acidobacteriota bacterium]